MIFYFSGTGNSLFVAKNLAKANEKLINIAEAIDKAEFDYVITENEPVGFVFPVYFYSLPSIVEDFVCKVSLTGQSYTYSVITCGGGIGQAGHYLKRCLKKQKIELNYVTDILMPDNSMLFYQIPDISSAGVRLDAAKIACQKIKNDIESRKKIQIGNSSFISKSLKHVYKLCMKTKKFYADDTCIGCGVCERNCPQKVIKIMDNKPEWVKERCCKCSSCINCCPVQAIQYGKGTKKRNRYKNPLV